MNGVDEYFATALFVIAHMRKKESNKKKEEL